MYSLAVYLFCYANEKILKKKKKETNSDVLVMKIIILGTIF